MTTFEQVEGGASGNLITAVFGKTGQLVTTKGRKAPGDGGQGTYMIKTAAQAAIDGDTIDDLGAGFTVADAKVAVLQDTIINSAHYGTFTGTPEANGILGRVGFIFTRTDGGVSTTLYIKESGANTDTGWIAK